MGLNWKTALAAIPIVEEVIKAALPEHPSAAATAVTGFVKKSERAILVESAAEVAFYAWKAGRATAHGAVPDVRDFCVEVGALLGRGLQSVADHDETVFLETWLRDRELTESGLRLVAP